MKRRKPVAEVWPTVGLRLEAGGTVGEHPLALIRPGLTP
jgi:hypothetical protein